MSEGELKKRIEKEICELEYGELKGSDRLKNGDLANDDDCLSDADIINPDAIWPILKEARTEFFKIEEKAVVEINKTNRDKVLSQYAKEMADWGRKWLGR